MIKSKRFFILSLYAGLLATYLPVSHANEYYDEQVENAAILHEAQSHVPCSYGQKINEKSLRILSNLGLGVMEIPKNVIIVTNDNNIFLGLTWGVVKGVAHTVGRSVNGVADLLTLPLPTKAAVYPWYPWEYYDRSTTYRAFFKEDVCAPNQGKGIAAPIPVKPGQMVAPVQPRPMPNVYR